MWYWILYFILAIWAAVDAKKRGNEFLNWALGTMLLGPIVLPIYLAKRNLKDSEIREGGTAWNILKNFALLWTLTMVIAGIVAAVRAWNSARSVTDPEHVGAAIGAGIGLVAIAAAWFFPMVAALILGVFLKKSTVVESGPGGIITGAVKKEVAEKLSTFNVKS